MADGDAALGMEHAAVASACRIADHPTDGVVALRRITETKLDRGDRRVGARAAADHDAGAGMVGPLEGRQPGDDLHVAAGMGHRREMQLVALLVHAGSGADDPQRAVARLAGTGGLARTGDWGLADVGVAPFGSRRCGQSRFGVAYGGSNRRDSRTEKDPVTLHGASLHSVFTVATSLPDRGQPAAGHFGSRSKSHTFGPGFSSAVSPLLSFDV